MRVPPVVAEVVFQLAVVAIVLMAVLLPFAVWYSIQRDDACRDRGGVPVRSVCFDRSAVLAP